ncbi:MAG: patatin-like phospholipase family protein [Elusimicrobiota bacterium]
MRTGRAALLVLLLASPAAAGDPAAPSPSDALLREHLWAQLRSLPPDKRPKVGVALSAGAVRGLAHVGVLQVLEDAGFPVDAVAGTSMGAVVGSLYAAGLDMAKLRTLPDRLTFSAGSNFNAIRLFQLFMADSLIDTRKFELFLKNEIGDKRFDQTPTPFACVAMDLLTGEKIIFREGPLAPAVRASSNLPGLFKPVVYRHRYLVDGGVVDYIPVDAVRLLGAEWVLASVTEGDFSKTVPSNVLMTLSQIFDIRGAILSRLQRKEADLIIEPAVGDVPFHDLSRAHEVIEKGMRAASRKLTAAEESLILFSLPRLQEGWVGKGKP